MVEAAKDIQGAFCAVGTRGGQTCASFGVPLEHNICRLAAGRFAKLVNDLNHIARLSAAGGMPIGHVRVPGTKPRQYRGRRFGGLSSVLASCL